MAIINFNVAASRMFGDNEHARIRIDGKKILIKPTNSATLALNKTTEDSSPVMRKLRVRSDGNRSQGVRLQTELDLPIGAKFELLPDTYGWFYLSPVDKVYPSMAGASISNFLDVFPKRPQVDKQAEKPKQKQPHSGRGRPRKDAA